METESKLSLAVIAVCVAAWTLFLLIAGFPSMGSGVSQHIYWYLGRASGFVAYWLLFGSVALGLAISSRVFDGMLARPWIFELHKFLSIFVLLVMAFHALIMLPDPWAGFTVVELLVPFKSHYRATAVGLGQLALYGSAIVTASFYLKRLVGQNGWRMLHYSTFALLLAAMAHGIWAGTDSGITFVQYSYLPSAVAILFLTFFRILATRAPGFQPRPAVAASSPTRPPATAASADGP